MMLQIPDYLNALTGASDAPIRLNYGDIDADVTDHASIEAVVAAADEPLYVRCVAGDDTVPFLYAVEENATADNWRYQTIPPTAALFKAGTLINAWSLETPAPAPVARDLAARMGIDIDDPIPTPGANGWELVRCDPDAFVAFDDLAALYESAPAHSGNQTPANDEAVQFHDARLLTPYDPADPAYAQEMIISIGGNRESKRWKPQAMPITRFIDLLSIHREDKNKDGLAFVLADIVGDQRRKVAVKACYGVGLDIDVGVSGDVIDNALKAMGCLAIRYTTHSHGKTTTLLNKDRLTRYAAKIGAGGVDGKVVARFLREEEEWVPEMIVSAEYVGDDHRPEGLMAQIEHAPMPKHRVVLPLAEAFEITKVAKTQDEGMRLWNEVPKALARALGDLPLDKAALDPSRLFYFPRHAPGRSHETTVFGGPLLDWRTLDVVQSPTDTFATALDREFTGTVGKGRSTTAEGQALARWSINAAPGFQIADVIRDHAEDRIRTPGAMKIEVECPFDDEHSNPGDPDDRACFVVNAGDGPSDVFTVKCMHDSCAGRTSLDMLGKMLKDDWIPAEVIDDEAYNAMISEAAAPVSPSLEGAFPLPTREYGAFSYQMFDGRPWVHKKAAPSGKAPQAPTGAQSDERLHTPCSIEAGIVFPDRNGQRALRVKVLDESGETQLVDLAAGMAVKGGGVELKVALREKGVLMTGMGEDHIVRMFKQVQPRDPITVHTRPGWHSGAFITPWGTVINTNRPIELSAENQPSGVETAGTLGGWIDATAAAFESDVLHFQVGVLAGFVSPILDLCGYPSVWIAYSGSTSKGKSTAQKLQAASWGDPAPKKGLFGNFNGTAAASEALLSRASGAGYAFDEAHTIDGGELQKLMFKATGDGGADRLTRNADLRASRSWTLLVSLSNETSLYQKIKGAGAAVTTGLGARALDLNVEDAPALDPNRMKRIETAFVNHGHAAPMFVRAMVSAGYVSDPDRLRREIDAKAEALAGPAAEPPVRRAARIAALTWQAGSIAQGAGLIPAAFDVKAMAQQLWEKALEADNAPGSADDLAVRTLFEALIKRRGFDIPESLSSSFRKAVAWRPHEFKKYGAVYIVPISTLAELAGDALNHTAMARVLGKRGLLIDNERKDKRSYIWDSIPDLGKVRAVVIPAQLVEGDGQEELAAEG